MRCGYSKNTNLTRKLSDQKASFGKQLQTFACKMKENLKRQKQKHSAKVVEKLVREEIEEVLQGLVY